LLSGVDLTEVIAAYASGYFLMADEAGNLGWYSSRRHALIPLDERFHVPRSLKRALNSGSFTVRLDGDFHGVVEGCAARTETWISPQLKEVYAALHAAGFAHSFETWHEGSLAGAVLGITIGAAFIGESMFFTVPEGSKVALVRLVEHLRAQGFLLFDAQLMNPHLERFGAYELPESQYRRLLARAVGASAAWMKEG
jgi:leucyl/phenylalanyl-tRNA--protein transferase